MWSFVCVLLGIFTISSIHALPVDKDSSSSEDDGIVYVFNIYSARKMKTRDAARLLSHGKSLEKIPSVFEPIGSFLLMDDGSEEPFTMEEFSEYMEANGITMEKMNEGNNIYEMKVDFDEIASIDEIIKFLEAEGIQLKMTQEGDKKIVEIEFDESIKDAEDQPFTLEELAHYFEDEGFEVELIKIHGKVVRVVIIFDESNDNSQEEEPELPIVRKPEEKVSEPKNERRINQQTDNEVIKVDDKKKEVKIEENEDKFVIFDYITRADSTNKIRRRRSTCPECKTASMIKELVNRYDVNK